MSPMTWWYVLRKNQSLALRGRRALRPGVAEDVRYRHPLALRTDSQVVFVRAVIDRGMRST